MNNNKYKFLFVLLFVFFNGCNSNDTIDFQRGYSPERLPIFKVSPNKMREVLNVPYILQPDKRFLIAFEELYRIFTQKQKVKANFELRNQRWNISYKSQHIGNLPEFPDFNDFMDLLQNWVEILNEKYPLKLDNKVTSSEKRIESLIKKFWSPDAVTALQEINKLWRNGKRSQNLIKLATQALVILNFQHADLMEIGDILPGRTLAFLALCKKTTSYKMEREEGLISSLMGYTTHSFKITSHLPEDDPIKLFLNHNDTKLQQLSLNKNGTSEARYFTLYRYAQKFEFDNWNNWRTKYYKKESYSLPVVKTGLDMKEFKANRVFGEALPLIVIIQLSREDRNKGLIQKLTDIFDNSNSEEETFKNLLLMKKLFGKSTASFIDEFEDYINNFEEDQNDLIWDKDIYSAYYRGLFYSSLYILGMHYLHGLSSIPAAREFDLDLGNGTEGVAGDFRLWYNNLIQVEIGRAQASHFSLLAENLNNIGSYPILKSFYYYTSYFGYGDPETLFAVRVITPRLDTRIEHRVYLSYMAHYYLMDLKLLEKINNSIIQQAPVDNEETVAFMANFNGDFNKLTNILESSDINNIMRLNIIKQIEEYPEADLIVQRNYQKLIQQEHYNWDYMSKYIDYLEEKGRYKLAQVIIEPWLKNHNRLDDGFDYISAKCAMARMLYKEENYEKAFNEILPILDSMQAGVMERTALILEKLNKNQDAIKLANFIIWRYPTLVRSRILLAGLYWRQNIYNEAARVIATSPIKLRDSDWISLADEFSKSFQSQTSEETKIAFLSLAQKVDQFKLGYFSTPLSKIGKHELAFKLLSQLKLDDFGNIDLLLSAYSELSAFKGKNTALGWLKNKIPTSMLNASSMIIYRKMKYDLLWDLISEPEKGEYPDFIWLIRAAAFIKQGLKNDPHKNELVSHFKKEGTNYYHDIGRYLMGFISEDEILLKSDTPQKRCEIPYYLGLKAQSEGRFEDASDWYRISIETGLVKNGEYRYSYDQLNSWAHKDKSLKQLAISQEKFD